MSGSSSVSRVVCCGCGAAIADLAVGVVRGPQLLTLCGGCRALGYRLALGRVPGAGCPAVELVEPSADSCLVGADENFADYAAGGPGEPVAAGQSGAAS